MIGYNLGMDIMFLLFRDILLIGILRVHFIPLSATYKEIYNIHSFFSGPTYSTLRAANSTQLHAGRRKTVEGDRRLRRIARAGKQWKQTMGRTIDMEGVPSLSSYMLPT